MTRLVRSIRAHTSPSQSRDGNLKLLCFNPTDGVSRAAVHVPLGGLDRRQGRLSSLNLCRLHA